MDREWSGMIRIKRLRAADQSLSSVQREIAKVQITQLEIDRRAIRVELEDYTKQVDISDLTRILQ